MRVFFLQLRELEEEIGIEQRLRTQAIQSKKKLEAQVRDLVVILLKYIISPQDMRILISDERG